MATVSGDEKRLRRLKADIESLCVSPRHSGQDAKAHRAATKFIAASLQDSGCVVEEQSFIVPSEPQPRAGLNIVGLMQPNIDDVRASSSAILIGAHYDSVPDSPGADDNASGVAVLLECARAISESQRKRPIIFAAFDAEERQPEVGLHGSTAFVSNLASTEYPRISAAYILEMVGNSVPEGGQKVPVGLQLAFPRAFDRLMNAKFAGNSVIAISDWRSRAAGRAFEAAARATQDGVDVLPMEIPRWMPVPHNLKRSDHAPFWSARIPAVMIGDTANFRNPNYHLPTDTPDTLDYALIDRVARTMIQLTESHFSNEEPRRKTKVKLR